MKGQLQKCPLNFLSASPSITWRFLYQLGFWKRTDFVSSYYNFSSGGFWQNPNWDCWKQFIEYFLQNQTACVFSKFGFKFNSTEVRCRFELTAPSDHNKK